MLLGLALLYVGAVLFLNGLWLMGHIGDREIAIINIFVGALTVLIALSLAFGSGADAGSIKAAGLTLLFSFTYLWVAYNRFNDVDGRGLGWFSLFVAITVVPVAIDTLSGADDHLGCLVRPVLGCMGGAVVHVLPPARHGQTHCQGHGHGDGDPGRADRLASRIPPVGRCHGTSRHGSERCVRGVNAASHWPTRAPRAGQLLFRFE